MRRIYKCCRENKKRKLNQEEKDKSAIFTVINLERECTRLKVAYLNLMILTVDKQDMSRRTWRL